MSNFQPVEVVCRGGETQLQMGENLNKLILQDKVEICMYQKYSSKFSDISKTCLKPYIYVLTPSTLLILSYTSFSCGKMVKLTV